MILQAPFPYFGGKSRVAAEVWERLGDVPNYIEPFFGSGAVLLARPHEMNGQTETVNDIDGMVSNFWRSIRYSPERTAEWADWPVNENDLHARHAWLVGQKENLRAKLEGDPEFHDPKIAGWWVWGICCWIGGEFCSGKGPWGVVDRQLVHLGDKGQGIHRKRIHLGDKGQGIHRKRIHLGDKGQGIHLWFQELSERLRRVRVACGDWKRICGPTPTTKLGLTGVFLDPPYASDRARLYTSENFCVAHEVNRWAVEHGDDPKLRIAVCGYDGDCDFPEGWDCFTWKANGGYGLQGNGNGRKNIHRERIWFSPHCLKTSVASIQQPLLKNDGVFADAR